MELVLRTEHFRTVSPRPDGPPDAYMIAESPITGTKLLCLLRAPQIQGLTRCEIGTTSSSRSSCEMTTSLRPRFPLETENTC